jgi:cysteine desulfurase
LTFTSGATEALHTVICGVVNAHDHVVVSAVEHPATWGALRRAQADVSVVPVDRLGRVDPAQVQAALKPDTKLVIQMAAQNELGVVYPTQEIASVIDGVPLLVDAAQAYGKVPLDLSETGATYAVVSGHKMGAPLGVGALWCRDGEPFTPYLEGGAQERGRRAGTENVPAIVGFGVAADEVEERLHRLTVARALLEAARLRLAQESALELLGVWGVLDQHGSSEASGVWRTYRQLPNTLCLRLLKHDGDLILQQLDLAGFCVSSGSACSSGALEPSPVLRALGLDERSARRGLRVSIGPQTSADELQRFTDTLFDVLKR